MRKPSALAPETLHLVESGKLKVIDRRLVWSQKDVKPVRIDLRQLKHVVCYGRVSISDRALQMLFKKGVEIAWMTPGGRKCHGRLVSAQPQKHALRLVQFQVLSSPLRVDIARWLVQQKIETQRQAVNNYIKRQQLQPGTCNRDLKRSLSKIPNASIEQLRGIEGTASRVWFRALSEVLQPPWEFRDRNRRPPRDPINALLSLGYTCLTTKVRCRLQAQGFEIQQGAYHELRPGRPSLACDLVEPFRVDMVDRWMLRLCHLGQVSPADFVSDPTKGVRLEKTMFMKILATWEEHLLKQQFTEKLDETVIALEHRLRSLHNSIEMR